VRHQTVLLLGPPGSGKGTQGKVLGTIPGFHHCSCGEVFRKIDPNSDVGRIFMDYSSRGELVPDDATVKIWHAGIRQHQYAGLFRLRFRSRIAKRTFVNHLIIGLLFARLAIEVFD